MYWIGKPVEELSSQEVGARNKRSRKNALNDFFNEMEEVINQLSQEDKAWLELKHSQQDENAQYLINVTTQKLAIEFNKTLAKEIDGEGRRITLTELADKLSQMAGFKIESINITNFLVYKGYFTIKRTSYEALF